MADVVRKVEYFSITVPDRPAQRAALEFASRKSGFLVQGEDRPGALAQHRQRLARAAEALSANG